MLTRLLRRVRAAFARDCVSDEWLSDHARTSLRNTFIGVCWKWPEPKP